MSLPSESGLVGQLLDGRYRIEAELGHGGMGAVYRATHVHLEQRVAIKVLRPHLAGDPVAARRFAREARGTFQLDSEHAVRVSDFGVTDDGLLYMVMEHLDGRTVADELGADGALSPRRAAHVAAQVCHALESAHRLGFVHRDLKPENIMLVRRGADPDWVKVLDFGLAKLIEGAGGNIFSVAALTQRDMVFGTPEYMAPEQAMGEPVDGRTDLYALGATLFEMLTGRPPFVDAVPMRLLSHHVKSAPPSLATVAPELAPLLELDALVRRCLAKQPAQRPQSAAELGAALRAIGPGLPGTAPRIPAVVAESATVDIEAIQPPAPPMVAPPMAFAAPAPGAPPAAASGALTALTPVTARSTRTAIISIGVAIALVAALVLIATRRGDPARRASISTSASDAGAVARALAPPDAGARLDAAIADAAAAPVDARQRAERAGPDEPPRATDDALAGHLAAAEAARRSGNRLRQLAEADAALARDARHVRARFLAGEALLETGDVANGCKYLRSARKISAARALLASGRCPDGPSD